MIADDTSPADMVNNSWQQGTIERILPETERVKSFTLRLTQWTAFKPGQHVDVRVPASDGSHVTGSYSIASAPEWDGVVELTVQLTGNDHVSAYFHEVIRPGDKLELRGPLGGDFTWTAALGGPLLLIAGGSGIVPLMSMLRHRANADPDIPALLLYSTRSLDEVIYRDELDRRALNDPRLIVLYTFTRRPPAGWGSYGKRVDRKLLADAIQRLGAPSHVYVCGAPRFVELIERELATLPVPQVNIRTAGFALETT
ncbi:MAG: FAD-binding oxidoreductase [Acidiferrobacterales bacterium]